MKHSWINFLYVPDGVNFQREKTISFCKISVPKQLFYNGKFGSVPLKDYNFRYIALLSLT
jgi:hypothetical protein